MNALSNQANVPITAPPESEEVSVDTIRARRRRRILVNSIRVLILVVFIGGWQFLTSVGIIDPFFWGQPSGIWNQLVTWVTQGTAQGPLWEQIAVTLEEAIIGFVIGVFFGVIFGVVLGRNPCRCVEPLHQSCQCDPTRHARAPVCYRAGPGDPIQDRSCSRAGLLHCVF